MFDVVTKLLEEEVGSTDFFFGRSNNHFRANVLVCTQLLKAELSTEKLLPFCILYWCFIFLVMLQSYCNVLKYICDRQEVPNLYFAIVGIFCQ